MKQGQASRNVAEGAKREPVARAVGEGAVARMGAQYVNTKPPQEMYQGRGYEAPKASRTVHASGSQGKHK